MYGAIAGLFWKKKHIYTVIHYNDYADSEADPRHSLILDFEDNLKYVYPLIFERMVKSRLLQTASSSSSISISDSFQKHVTMLIIT
jgi:hypothetical protein